MRRISGGNNGIGLATAQLFKQEGATVIVTARNEKRLEESKTVVGEGIEIVVADVGKMDQLEALFEHVGNQHGRIDVLFVNAGLGLLRPFGMVEEDRDSVTQGFMNVVPIQRLGTPEELAATVLFLASEESAFIVGEEIVVDGGISNT